MPPKSFDALGVQESKNLNSTRKGQAWRRYAAKQIDTSCCFAIAFSAAPSAGGWQESGPWPWLFCSLLYCAFAVLFDAGCISTFATTPGKFLFGIRMHDKQGRVLGFAAALRRSGHSFFYGSALTIPGLDLLACSRSYRALIVSGATSWDQDICIVAPGLSTKRKVIIVTVLLGPFLLVFLLALLIYLLL